MPIQQILESLICSLVNDTEAVVVTAEQQPKTTVFRVRGSSHRRRQTHRQAGKDGTVARYHSWRCQHEGRAPLHAGHRRSSIAASQQDFHSQKHGQDQNGNEETSQLFYLAAKVM
jgi:hypothetical protein